MSKNIIEVKPGTKKIETSLSVAELGYFVRILLDNKILLPKHKTEVSRLFAAIFSTKKQDNISFESLRNNCNVPKNSSVESIRVKMLNLVITSNKDKTRFLR